MCSKLNIPRSSYYKWLNREIPEQEKENGMIATLVLEYDERFRHILGYRRMTLWINGLNGKHYSKNRIHRIMKALNVHAVIRRKRRNYTAPTPEIIADNILKRNFTASKPNEKWATDITEFTVPGTSKKLYLSAIIDLYDRSVISYVVSKSNNNNLVFDTYKAAILNNPDARPLFHSDRGFQYTSKVFQWMLREQGVTQSMSRVGHCIDNGPTEGFWGIVKTEMFQLYAVSDENSLRNGISQFISFYNNERFQERFGGKTPFQVRTEALATTDPIQYSIPENKRIQKYKSKYAAQ